MGFLCDVDLISARSFNFSPFSYPLVLFHVISCQLMFFHFHSCRLIPVFAEKFLVVSTHHPSPKYYFPPFIDHFLNNFAKERDLENQKDMDSRNEKKLKGNKFDMNGNDNSSKPRVFSVREPTRLQVSKLISCSFQGLCF